MTIFKQLQAVVLSFTITTMVIPGIAASREGPAETQGSMKTETPTSGTPSPKELQTLVAPIALYPDGLVAQVLAASTYPTQVVEAERWIKENGSLKGQELAKAVDQQPFDPSIKALTEFPQVLGNMSANLSWTSALGDAYTNDPKGVMNAVQVLRKDAQQAGNLKSTEQQSVSTEGTTIVIEPSNPEVVYVPSYSPEVYGVPMASYPGYSGWGTVAAGAISFGAGMAVGAAFGGYGWGWNSWGANWRGGNVTYNRNTFVSNSNTFANRNLTNVNRQAANLSRGNLDRSNINRGNIDRSNIDRSNIDRGNLNQGKGISDANRSFDKPAAGQFNRQDSSANRGFGAADRSSSIGRSSGAFGGFSQGGSARMSSARGSSSFSGGGRGGGGRGGGGRGGGGRGGGGGRR
jgi:Protein of unknown function (DUF3300)